MEYRKKSVCAIAFVVINVIVFFVLSFGGATEDAYYMFQHGAMYAPSVFVHGEYYRLFTSIFLHFGFTHLMNNMVSLIILGNYLEPAVGKVRFAIIYIVSGLGGNLLSYGYELMTEDYAISAGASGAVFGLTGALFCLTLLNRGRAAGITRRGMLVMIGVSLYNGFASEGVDNMAHIGGLVFGFLITLLLCFKKYRKSRSNTWGGFHGDEAAMSFDDSFGNGQS